MIHEAMLWQMHVTSPRVKGGQSTLTRSLGEEIEAATAHYAKTRPRVADLCLVHPRHAPTMASVNGCAVQAVRSATPFCLIVGVSQQPKEPATR